MREDGIQIELRNKILSMSDQTVVCLADKNKKPYSPLSDKLPADLSADFEGEEVVYTADAVICALGMKANDTLSEQLMAAGLSVEVIGDAVKARKVMNAVQEGFQAGRRS